MAKLEFFFDCSSPWTYLAFTRIHDIIKRTQASVEWRPILVGGIFNTVNQDVYQRRANPDDRKAPYYKKDLQDWARFTGIRIGQPPVFPVRAVEPMRAVIAANEKGKLLSLSKALFEAYWGDLEDISQKEVLTRVFRGVDLDPDWMFGRMAAPEIKEQLKTNTDEVIARGGFGSPSMFVDRTDMYFGNDRLPLVEAALSKAR